MGRKWVSTLLIGAGLLCMLAALALVLYNDRESDRAEEAAAQVNVQLSEAIQERVEEYRAAGIAPPSKYAYVDYMDVVPDMPTVEIEGYEYIGVIEVPAEEISLPVMAQWDYVRLKISPCRFTGSYYTNDLVICGHNYSRHFYQLLSIAVGTDVYFTNVDGVQYHYVVTNREEVYPMEVDRMTDAAAGKWDLTLFTCFLGGRTRCAVRCVRVEE
ncbi:MAG: sortase [Lachnospiraceae bacterium]|nr:sortase [Lachnospiraceae bacterium]